MLRRVLLIKLKPELVAGLEFSQLRSAIQTALGAAYGVQRVQIERSAGPETQQAWDLCVSLEYVSGVDEQRSSRDAIVRAFEDKFLASRAERVWSGVFDDAH